MLKNYLKIAWRNISRHKIYTLINVTGLALGICACLVIYLINSYDLSFDRFHPDGNRIFRIVGEVQRGNEKLFLNSPFSDVAGFQNQIPGFESESGYHQYGAKTIIPVIGQPAKKFNGDLDNGGIASIITGPSYFDIFKYQWLAGNAASLNDPFRVVITESRARQFFGNLPLTSMIGKTVIYDDSLKVTVSGIIKDWDKKSDFAYTEFISISTATHSFLKNRIPTEDWTCLSPHQSQAFVKLSMGTSAVSINAAFAAFIKKYSKLGDQGSNLKMWLQPLTEIHFTPDFHRGDDGDNQFRKAYLPTIYALMGAALFILLIAAINFINLSTAQSIRRAKETGIRKVLGSKRTSLIFQFLTETFVLTLMAVFTSVLLVKPVLTLFSNYIPDGVNFILNTGTIIFLISVLVITTLSAGFYPAIVLSSYLPVQSLKGAGVKINKEKWYLRKLLIVFQFSISLIFIIATLVIGKQIRYMRDSDKGFKTDAIITIQKVWRDHSNKANNVAENIKRISGVDEVILEAFAPMGFPHMMGGIEYKGNDDIKFNASYQPGGAGYIPFYEMKLLAGRNLFTEDSLKEIVVNETFAKSLGFPKPEQVLGKNITCLGGESYTIVGVVADFHENSFHEPMKPVVIVHLPVQEKGIAIKLSSKGMQASEAKLILAEVEKLWKKAYPEENFKADFLNESIRWLYDQETKTAWLMNVVMIITIFISCMGLFGLAMFTAEQRTREISIRKILGATVANIITLLSKDFVVLVIISLIVASPVAWYFMNNWLDDFAYRIHFSWSIFLLAGSIAVLIALLTVSFQAVKSAMANPVNSLRSE
ncbi:MAG TPA: ABC transporter permease [Puia sp.]|jgi:putative ABC transport system permease protein|nr:ABC transporter permease [Puia sp.]